MHAGSFRTPASESELLRQAVRQIQHDSFDQIKRSDRMKAIRASERTWASVVSQTKPSVTAASPPSVAGVQQESLIEHPQDLASFPVPFSHLPSSKRLVSAGKASEDDELNCVKPLGHEEKDDASEDSHVVTNDSKLSEIEKIGVNVSLVNCKQTEEEDLSVVRGMPEHAHETHEEDVETTGGNYRFQLP